MHTPHTVEMAKKPVEINLRDTHARVDQDIANHAHLRIQYLDGELCQGSEQLFEIAHSVGDNRNEVLGNDTHGLMLKGWARSLA